jgi:hypothetical protein
MSRRYTAEMKGIFRIGAVLWALLLPALATAQEVGDPSERKNQRTPEESRRFVAAAGTAMAGLSQALLDRAVLESPQIIGPEIIGPAIAATKEALAAKYRPGDPALNEARFYLCMVLLDHAPKFGVADFEDLEANVGTLDPKLFLGLRFYAANAYTGLGQAERAVKQFQVVAESADSTPKIRGMAYFMVGMLASTPEAKAAAFDRAEEHWRGLVSADSIAMRRVLCGDFSRAQQVLNMKPAAGKERDWAAAMMLATVALHGKGDLTIELAVPKLEEALATLTRVPAPSGPMVDAYICFAGAVRTVAPELSLRAAAEAESLAARDLKDDARRNHLARLCRAKVLRLLNRADELKPYADLDLSEVIGASWKWDTETESVIPLIEDKPSAPR